MYSGVYLQFLNSYLELFLCNGQGGLVGHKHQYAKCLSETIKNCFSEQLLRDLLDIN
jgi:hypothetical protein